MSLHDGGATITAVVVRDAGVDADRSGVERSERPYFTVPDAR